jgi:hypothetical protein
MGKRGVPHWKSRFEWEDRALRVVWSAEDRLRGTCADRLPLPAECVRRTTSHANDAYWRAFAGVGNHRRPSFRAGSSPHKPANSGRPTHWLDSRQRASGTECLSGGALDPWPGYFTDPFTHAHNSGRSSNDGRNVAARSQTCTEFTSRHGNTNRDRSPSPRWNPGRFRIAGRFAQCSSDADSVGGSSHHDSIGDTHSGSPGDSRWHLSPGVRYSARGLPNWSTGVRPS